MADSAGQTKGTVLRLGLGGVGMFGFAFAVVPLYDVICEVTGLNGKTGGRYEAAPAALKPDLSRDVQIRFVTNTNAAMPWHFGAKQGGMTVNPGGVNLAMFYAENPTDRPMVAQTIPSIAPGRAASYFHKTECFCFDQQVLMPGEKVEMPMRFIVDRDLPEGVVTISLSYTMFDITDQASGRYALEKALATKRAPVASAAGDTGAAGG
jgi:cytochrome c oxidase assembly protein subunit 11